MIEDFCIESSGARSSNLLNEVLGNALLGAIRLVTQVCHNTMILWVEPLELQTFPHQTFDTECLGVDTKTFKQSAIDRHSIGNR